MIRTAYLWLSFKLYSRSNALSLSLSLTHTHMYWSHINDQQWLTIICHSFITCSFFHCVSGDDLNISIAYRQILYFFDENCTNVEICDENKYCLNQTENTVTSHQRKLMTCLFTWNLYIQRGECHQINGSHAQKKNVSCVLYVMHLWAKIIWTIGLKSEDFFQLSRPPKKQPEVPSNS